MIRRWGFTIFFLLALLLSAGAWVGSYWWYVGIHHYAGSTRKQEIYVRCGCVSFVSNDVGLLKKTWYVWNSPVDDEVASWQEEEYRIARWHFLGFASQTYTSLAMDMLIIPLWFPTALSGLGLLWAWRRKRRSDRTRGKRFEVQQPKHAG